MTLEEALTNVQTQIDSIALFEEYYTKQPGRYSCGCGEYVLKSNMLYHNKVCNGGI